MMKTIQEILVQLGEMAWNIYWGLAFGFILSSVIRAFVATETISEKLGKDNLKSLSLATFFGGISSSCSYAAASMSRTLLMKGASWANSLAFLISSTNLVFEIFIVIYSLLGLAFVGGEIVGGILFILVTAASIVLFFPKKVAEDAGKHLHHDHSDNHHHHSSSPTTKSTFKEKLKAASGHFYMDVMMVGKDILIGVAIAAVLSIIVPQSLWTKIFLNQNSELPQIAIVMWNALIGIVVAIVSFVCSVGNIVLAAVLWHGGITFGGVIAFILSDLVTLPMLLVYRKYYGFKATIGLFILLSVGIFITAIAVDYSFTWLNWIPQHPETALNTNQDIWVWNYKTILNILFIPTSIIYFFIGKKQMKTDMKMGHHH